LHPILFDLAGIPVSSYGLALGIAFAVGIAVAMRRARSAGLDPDVILEAGVVALVTSLVGSRALFALEHPEAFGASAGPVAWLRPLPGAGMKGLSMSLGVLLATACSLLWLRLRRQPVLRAADLMAPSVALGEGITRIGCFLNGCCFGMRCSLPWGVRFPERSPAGSVFGDVAIHPTQLYASVAAFALAAVLLGLSRRARRPGSVFFAFLALWAALRLAIDRLRYYPPDLTALHVGSHAVVVHQLFVGALLVAGIAGLLAPSSRGRTARG
jgi:phosphatidylglycerol:prolipoprotein diacylglycerol transferase